jgi:hypothetical protein
VINRKKHSDKRPAKQAAEAVIPEPNKIGASTSYDFEAKNLTAYGGLLPVATMPMWRPHMRILAAIHPPEAIRKILACLGAE